MRVEVRRRNSQMIMGSVNAENSAKLKSYNLDTVRKSQDPNFLKQVRENITNDRTIAQLSKAGEHLALSVGMTALQRIFLLLDGSQVLESNLIEKKSEQIERILVQEIDLQFKITKMEKECQGLKSKLVAERDKCSRFEPDYRGSNQTKFLQQPSLRQRRSEVVYEVKSQEEGMRTSQFPNDTQYGDLVQPQPVSGVYALLMEDIQIGESLRIYRNSMATVSSRLPNKKILEIAEAFLPNGQSTMKQSDVQIEVNQNTEISSFSQSKTESSNHIKATTHNLTTSDTEEPQLAKKKKSFLDQLVTIQIKKINEKYIHLVNQSLRKASSSREVKTETTNHQIAKRNQGQLNRIQGQLVSKIKEQAKDIYEFDQLSLGEVSTHLRRVKLGRSIANKKG